MKTERLSKVDWQNVLDMHQLFDSINQAVIRKYAETSPVEALNLIFGPHGIVCDGVLTLYPDPMSDKGYFVRVERVDGKTTWNLDMRKMPHGEGGFLNRMVTLKEPEIFSNITSEITVKDLKTVPWLAKMKTALAVPTIGVKAEPATSVLFSYEEDAYTYQDIWKNVILTYAITNILLNMLLRRETDRAYRALDEELNIIASIQRQLLPEKLPDTDGLEWAAHYSTSARAGGDYYDFFPLPNDQIGVIIADVSGHGSPAAVVMSMTRLILHTYPGEVQPPGEVLENMNRILEGHILPGQFVTAFYGIIDLKNRTLICSNAGHCSPRLFCDHNDVIDEVKSKGGLPLGISADGGFETTSIKFKKGDIFVFFTDGLTEAMNRSNELYGEERLESILKGLSNESAGEIKDIVLKDVSDFCEGVPLKDDLTVIVSKVKK